MSTYIYKSISNLDDAATISDDDILLISLQINNQLISKKITVNDVINYIYPKVEDYVDESVNGYLPLIAGVNNVVLGEIYTTAHNAMSLHSLNTPLILNGNSSKLKCGKLKLHSSESINEHTLTGGFELEVNSHNTTYSLKGYNTGSLKWNDKNIVRSVNNNEALDNGDITLLSVESTNKLNNPITITLSGDLSGAVSFDGSSNVDLSAYITKTIKDKFLSSDIEGQLSTSLIAGLNTLAFKDTILSSDIEGQLSTSLIEGLKDLAFKDTILSSDIEGQLSTSLIAGLKTELDSKISSVIVTPNLTAGTEIATIDVNGESKTLYVPEGSVVRGGVANIVIGSVIAFAGENIPDNTLLCDGSEVSKTDYEALWLVIGDKYGEASDSSKFKLPNLNERFIEGISSDLSVGTYVEAGLPNIEGNINASGGDASGALDYSGSKVIGHGSSYSYGNTTFDASKSNEIYGKSNTVQPPAILMKYVIVYKQLEDGNVIINTEGGSGGVIDGTVLETNTYSNLNGNPFKYSYTVKNDCLLAINGKYTTAGSSTSSIKVNGNIIVEYRDPNGITNDEYPINFPVKKGSVVDVENTHSMSNVEITFTEFKLNSLNPQIAFPDWDESKAKTIQSGWTATDNGFVVIKCLLNGNVKINEISVFDATGDDFHSNIIPICKGDNITYQNISTSIFYPVKSVSQEIPSNCASYVVESGKFNSSTGTTDDSDDSKNDSWYRVYSDGWCELGGYILNLTFNWSTCSVLLKKTYSNINYAILHSIDRTNDGVNMSVCYTTNKTTNSFDILKDNASVGAAILVGNISWESKGFIN